MLINKYRRNNGSRKPPFGTMVTTVAGKRMLKLGGEKYVRRENIYIVSKYSPVRYLLLTKGQQLTLQCRNRNLRRASK